MARCYLNFGSYTVCLNAKGQIVQMCNQIYINPRDHTYSLQNLCHCFTSVRCVRPSPPENGYQIASSQHFQSPGSLILFRCGSGYSLNGSARITCQDNGTWNQFLLHVKQMKVNICHFSDFCWILALRQLC